MRSLGGFLSIGLVVVATTGGALTDLSAAERPKAQWHENFEEAQKSAKSLGKPLLIHFYASWCGPCQQMEHSVLNTTTVTQQLGQCVIGVKINTDSRPDLSSKFGVGSLPSDVFVSPDGTVLSRDSGATSPDGYRQRILGVSNKYASAKFYKLVAGSVAKETEAEAETDESGEEIEAEPVVGLGGYCPVSVLESKKLVRGSSEFACEHAGTVYYMASAAALAKFEKDPKRFTPAWLGHDPLEFISKLNQVAGDIRFGTIYRKKLYLLSSEQNRKDFKKNPDAYIDTGATN